MVRVSRPLPFLLLASAALVVADPHPHSATNALSSAHTLHERTLLGGILGALFGSGHNSRCPSTFKCDGEPLGLYPSFLCPRLRGWKADLRTSYTTGSGTDGYAYDTYGNSCPVSRRLASSETDALFVLTQKLTLSSLPLFSPISPPSGTTLVEM